MITFIVKDVPEASKVVVEVNERPVCAQSKQKLPLERKGDCWVLKAKINFEKVYYYYHYYSDGCWKREKFFNTPFGLRISDVKENLVLKDNWNQGPKQNKRRACAFLWKNPIIGWDGKVTVCCNDFKFEMGIGNVKKNDIDDLWKGEKITSYRLAHITGEFFNTPKAGPHKVPICLTCWNQLDMSDEEVEIYCKKINRKDLFDIYKKRMNIK